MATDKTSAHRRIDVHHHLCPPLYAQEASKSVSLFPALADWTPQRSVEDMDAGGVETAILSMSTPGVWFGDDQTARTLARICNDYMARMVADHRGRFGFFATVPMPDIEGSLSELEYALDVLKADGVCLFTSYGTKYLGDADFFPVLEELNRRKAIIYTHPTISPCVVNLLPVVSEAIIEYGTDTTRAIASLVFSGVGAKLQDTQFIWSHAGGTMPFLISRFTQHMRGKPASVSALPHGMVPEIQRYYYDTAQSTHHPVTLSALKHLVGTSQILFGTDFPWGRAKVHADGLDGCDFTEDDRRKIDRENALRLLGTPGVSLRSGLAR